MESHHPTRQTNNKNKNKLIMKTAEQHKQDVLNYLRKTTGHRFIIKNELMHVEETEEGVFFLVKNGKPGIKPIFSDCSIEDFMKNNTPPYGNTKNILKHSIFGSATCYCHDYHGHIYTSIKRKYYDKLMTEIKKGEI
jgi:hypothetical protein